MQQAEQQPYVRMGTVRVPYGTHEAKAKATGEGYTPFSNLFLQNHFMSDAAKGFLCERLSYAEGYLHRIEDCVNRNQVFAYENKDKAYNVDGRYKIMSQIEELIDLGHCCKVIERNAIKGNTEKVFFQFFELPQTKRIKNIMLHETEGGIYASEPKTKPRPKTIKINEDEINVFDLADRFDVPVEKVQSIIYVLTNQDYKNTENTEGPVSETDEIIKTEENEPQKNSSVVERPLEEEETEIFEQSPIEAIEKTATTTKATKVSLSFKDQLKGDSLLKSKLLFEKKNVTEEDYDILIVQFTEWDGSKAHKAYKDYEHHFKMWIRNRNIDKWRADYKKAMQKTTPSVLSDQEQEDLRAELKQKRETIKINAFTTFEYFDRALTDFLKMFKKCLDAHVLNEDTTRWCRQFSDIGATRTMRRAYFEEMKREFNPDTGERKDFNNFGSNNA
jgi:hypothetical protein